LIDQRPANTFCFGRRIAKKDGSIGPQLLLEGPAQQLVDGTLGGFANDVPKSDLNPAHRLNNGPLPAKEDSPFVHPVDEAVDREGILSQDTLGEPATDLVRERRFDDRFGNLRRGINFAYADDSFVGVHLDDESFLAAVATVVDGGEA